MNLLLTDFFFEDYNYEGFNNNPRCFLAIEIEKSGSRKHRLGDILNTAILGKIGIVIPFNDKCYDSFTKLLKYLKFANERWKIDLNIAKNVNVLRKERFHEILEDYVSYS